MSTLPLIPGPTFKPISQPTLPTLPSQPISPVAIALSMISQEHITLVIGVLALIYFFLGLISVGLTDQIQNVNTTVQCLSSSQIAVLTNMGITGGVVFAIIVLLIAYRMYLTKKMGQKLYHPINIILIIAACAFLASTIMVAVAAKKISTSSSTTCLDSTNLRSLKSASAICIVLGVLIFSICFASSLSLQNAACALKK